jgi:acylphosphatase
VKRLEASIYGRVQGVYFRATTQQRARQLALSGWVRNEPDGSVRAVAEGSEAALQQFLRFLQSGPPGAYVGRVDARWAEATGTFSGFQVRR